MGLGRYLATALLAGAAFLYSPSLHAEDIQQKVAFKDSAAQARVTPGRDLEGTLNVSASRDKNKLVLEVSAGNCEIRTGFSEFYIGLPAESEIAEMKQRAKIKERAQDGRGEEKWIDLYPVNELVEKGIFKAADYVADKVKVPVLTELLIDKVEKTKAARIQEWYKQMKKKGLFMEELSPDYPKIPSAYLTNISRRYEITLDVEPTKVPEARIQVCLQDQYERNITINDISVKFDGRKIKQQVQVNVPKGLEKFLINDKDFVPTKFFGPEEINKILGTSVKDSYLIEYQSSPESREDFTIYAYILGEESKKLKKESEVIKKVGKLMGEIPAECILNSNLSVGYKEGGNVYSIFFPPAETVTSKGMVLAIYVGFPSNNLINKHLEKKEDGNKIPRQIYDKNLFESTCAVSEKLVKVLDPLFMKGGVNMFPLFFVD